MEITDLINGKVSYDKYGSPYLWIETPDREPPMLAELRCRSNIGKMFTNEQNSLDFATAQKFERAVGEFIAAAINEKIERERNVNV